MGLCLSDEGRKDERDLKNLRHINSINTANQHLSPLIGHGHDLLFGHFALGLVIMSSDWSSFPKTVYHVL